MIVKVRVNPKARANLVVEAEGRLKVSVTAAPEDGKANRAVIKVLAKHFGVALSKIRVIHGETSRDKTIKVELEEGEAGRRGSRDAGNHKAGRR